MEQYPDEEEEFQLRYQDELEVLDENECADQTINTQVSSPKLSQISYNNGNFISGHVNRCLFKDGQRISSTPLTKETNLNLNKEVPILQELQNVGLQNKRLLERDLFGDIEDLYEDEIFGDPASKRAKTEEERDFETIDKILKVRSRLRETTKAVKTDNLLRLQALHDFKSKNLSNTVPPWPFLLLKSNEAQCIYVRFHSEEYEAHSLAIPRSANYDNLLGSNKEQVWNEANTILLNRTIELSSLNSAIPSEVINNVEVSHKSSSLWVEKYKPRKYIDLLSDEMTNRSLLYWLKMWDKVVFGRPFKTIRDTTASNQLNTFNKRTGRFESNGGWRQRKYKQMLNTNVDEIGRPIQKVALLCGPPGLGKTTLAHTIAQHAGYSVREINASDDRSPEAFKLVLENGTQMSSVLNSQRRPNCIILDEIDGAPRQAIEFLIKYVTDNVSNKTYKKGSKTQRNILKRPIICICNDVYEPALRQLRQIAFMVTFPPIHPERLAERLQMIAKKEHIKTDFGTLIALAEKSGCDVRSCISTLQFFSTQKKSLTLHDVLSNTIGQKDRHQGLFDIWNNIFRIQRPRKQLELSEKNSTTSQTVHVSMTNMSVSTRFQNVLDVVHSCGDYERIMQGVYENFLHQKMPDPNLSGIVEALQWFCFSDTLFHEINHLQNYIVYPYLQFGFVVWHLLFASLAWPKINFPMRGFEFNQKLVTQRNIFQSFRKGITHSKIGLGEKVALLLETVPALKRILSPQIRSVAIQLLTQKEQVNLKHTVEVMADLGLNYTQVKTTEGSMTFQMEPDLVSLSQFPGFPSITLAAFSKQLILREVELAQIRRITPKPISSIPEEKKSEKATTKIIFNPLLKSKSSSNNNFKKPNNETVSKDFFGRIKQRTTTSFSKKCKTDCIVKSPIWYRYKEGFNNAVRKDIYYKDLL